MPLKRKTCSVFKVYRCIVLTGLTVVECWEGDLFCLGVSGNFVEGVASRNAEVFKSLVQGRVFQKKSSMRTVSNWESPKQ